MFSFKSAKIALRRLLSAQYSKRLQQTVVTVPTGGACAAGYQCGVVPPKRYLILKERGLRGGARSLRGSIQGAARLMRGNARCLAKRLESRFDPCTEMCKACEAQGNAKSAQSL